MFVKFAEIVFDIISIPMFRIVAPEGRRGDSCLTVSPFVLWSGWSSVTFQFGWLSFGQAGF